MSFPSSFTASSNVFMFSKLCVFNFIRGKHLSANSFSVSLPLLYNSLASSRVTLIVVLFSISFTFNCLYFKGNEKIWKYQMFHLIIPNFNFCSHINFNEFSIFQLIPSVFLNALSINIFGLDTNRASLSIFSKCYPISFFCFCD